MSDHDPRCCGSGMCIIDMEGRCWCGQLWDGERMCHPREAPRGPDASEVSGGSGAAPASPPGRG